MGRTLEIWKNEKLTTIKGGKWHGAKNNKVHYMLIRELSTSYLKYLNV